MKIYFEKIRNIRRSTFVIILTLLMMGVVMIYSSSAIYAYEKFGDSTFFLKRHLLFLLIGFVLMFYAMLLDLKKIKALARPLLIFSLFLLTLVLIPKLGITAGGARRWLRVAGFSFQPSEFAKFAFILYLADYVSRKGYKIKDLYAGFLPIFMVVCVTSGLILIQPDLGTSIALFFVGFLVIFVAGGNPRHLLSTIALGTPLLYYLVFSVPYRRKRMLIFLNPWSDSRGSGFQIIQSFLALGTGGLFGVGLGQSKQKLFYLPESHTDFIFSIIGEELGFIGAAAVVVLFGLFTWMGMSAFLKEKRPFNKILIFGITSMIAFEALVNIGVSLGAFPTKGLPLPFISYGGSSLVFHMLAVGLLLNAMRE